MSDAFKHFEADGWNAAASTYDSLTGRATALAFEPLLDLARVGAGTHVLDVGCGPGGLTRAAADRGACAVGVDLADAMVAAARQAHGDCEFEVGDAEDLPFDAGRFDVALGAFVLNHVPEPERVAAEAARVTAPGGLVAFAVWDVPERARVTSLLADAMARAALDRAAGLPDGPDDARFADERAFTALLAGAGLEAIENATLEGSVVVGCVNELWDGLVGGTVRSSAALRAHGQGTHAAVRRALEDLCRDFASPDGTLEVPTVIKLACGRRIAT